MDNLTTLYTPRNMIEALEQQPPVNTFLLDTLVTDVEVLETDTIELDTIKGGQTISAYSSREGDAVHVDKRGYDTVNHVAPYIFEDVTATPKDLKMREPGQNVYEKMSPQDRLDIKVGRWLKDLRDRRIRREEQQLAEGITTGKVVVSGKDVSYTIDYQMAAANLPVNAGADIWGSTTEDKLDQFRTDAGTIRNAGAGIATDVVLGKSAATDFINDTAILGLINNRRVEIGEINVRLLADQSAAYLGRISYPGFTLDFWSYEAQYKDSAGSLQLYIPTNKYVMFAAGVSVKKYYTTIENLKAGTMMGEEFVMWDVANNGKKATLSYESGPLAAVRQPDGFVTRTVKP